MNLANAIIGQMKMGVYYRPCDIAIQGKSVTNSDKKRVLDMLVRGGHR